MRLTGPQANHIYMTTTSGKLYASGVEILNLTTRDPVTQDLISSTMGCVVQIIAARRPPPLGPSPNRTDRPVVVVCARCFLAPLGAVAHAEHAAEQCFSPLP